MTGHSHLVPAPHRRECHRSGTAENRAHLARAGSDLLGAVVRSESRFQGVSRGRVGGESEHGGVPSKVVELLLG